MEGNIYLIGFMATGKSTVGTLLSRALQREFVETDREIETEEGRSIADIFAASGEAYFREKEKALLRDISRRKRLVVSCGGGIILDKENRDVLMSTGEVVCLTATPEAICERVGADRARPLLNVKDPLGEITRLLEERARYYEQAHYRIDTTLLDCRQVAGEIIARLADDKKITPAD